MVVFACSACGESLKKNQVENHYLRKCRNCNMLSCLDCGKDFWGNEYEQHTKCITEEEKYSGKNFVPKPGSNKNEVKQQQWLQQVQDAVDKCRTNPRLKSLLIRLKEQPNVPRKKNKFLNFLANGFHVKDPNLASQVWEVLMENTENKQQDSNQSNNISNDSNKTEKHSTDVKHVENSVCNGNTDSVDTNHVNGHTTEVESKKLSKREKKEERRKKLNKAEKKDKNKSPDEEVNGVSETVSKKKSKRKDAEEGRKDYKKSKKRKREADLEDEQEEEDADEETGDQSICEEDTEEPAKKKFKTKFNWNDVIVEVLQTKGPEMKMKKLKKKVLAEYLSQGCTEKSEEKLWARFDKKLKKIPEVKVMGERVKLKAAS